MGGMGTDVTVGVRDRGGGQAPQGNGEQGVDHRKLTQQLKSVFLTCGLHTCPLLLHTSLRRCGVSVS
ncbi:unnamed protein product [Gadus morhua 'NCC']